MANNIGVTPGAGATVATDQLGTGEHVQLIKLMAGTEDSTERIGGDAANGLDVDVTRVQGTVTVDSELTTADVNSGAGTDTRAVVGLVLSSSTGGQLWPGDSTLGAFVQVTSMPGSSLSTDANAVGLMTNVIMNGATSLTPKFAKANVTASSTDSNIVSAVGGKKIRVLQFRIHTAGTATNVTFNSKPAGSGTAISELFAAGANGGRSESFTPVGHFETVSGEGLTVTTGAGSTTGIGVVYVEV